VADDPRWTHDRRISAGDWVRLAGNAPSLRGVGKVVDGDYDPRDHTMRAACVDMGTRTYWVPPADLARVTPEDEVRLCELALERGVLDAERDPSRVDRLERALAGLRQGTARYVRTPGLLDVLWGGSIHADPDHGSRAIAGFLDEAVDLLAAARRDPRRRPPARPSADDDGVTIRELLAAEARARAEAAERDRDAPRRLAAAAEERARKLAADAIAQRALAAALAAAPKRPRVPPAPVPPAEVLPRILHVLNNQPLADVARKHGLPVPPRRKGSARVLASAILAAGVPLQAVLDVLTLNQLRQACAAVGLQGEIEGDPALLRARLRALSS
jgi:hypothetical protein